MKGDPFPILSLHSRAPLCSCQSEEAGGLSRPETEQREPVAQRMLRSPRPTQRARALPGVQVAGLSLCRRLCVRGQHTKTHFLGASLPDRPAHSWSVAFLRSPPGPLRPRVPGTGEQRPCGKPSESLAWWRRWLGLARLFRQPRRPTQQSLQSLCERQALRRWSVPACSGRASCGLGLRAGGRATSRRPAAR